MTDQPTDEQPSSTDENAHSEQPQRTPKPFAWRPWGWGAALVLLVAAVYLPTLRNGFIWDDETYIVGNPTLRSWQGLYDIWLKARAIPQYYPLVHTVLWAEFHLWGFDPRGYHLVNLALHATAVVLLWRVLLRLAVPGAWVAAAIYAVHPVCVESVAWATELKNVLSGSLALGSILAYLRYSPPEVPAENAPQKTDWSYETALGLFIAALFSKTVTAVVPAVLLVIYWWKRGRIERRDLADLAPMFGFGAMLAGVTAWLEKAHVGASGSEWDFSIFDRLLIAGHAIVFYAGKLFWPHPLIFFYPRWRIDASDLAQWLYPLGVLATVATLWLLRSRIGRGPVAAVLIFIGVLTPVLGFFNVYPFRFSFVADHFQYHACIALITLATAAAALVLRRYAGAGSWAAGVAATVVIIPLAVLAHQKTYVYRNLVTLYTDVLRWNPQSWAAEINLAGYLDIHGHTDEARKHYNNGLENFTKANWRLGDLGRAFEVTGRLDEGIEQLTADLDGELPDWDRAETHRRLADLLMLKHSTKDAVEHYRASLAIEEHNMAALTGLGTALAEEGNFDEAIETLQKAIDLPVSSARAHLALGKILRKQGKPREAVAALARAVELNSSEFKAREELAMALYSAGELQPAAVIAQQVLAANPRSANCLNLIGAVRMAQGDVRGAIADFEAALAADPTHADAAANLQRAHGAVPATQRP